MNNEEAKLILQAYRLGGQDANDPQFREALEQAQRDPDLARWWADERALETRVQAALKTALQPPPRLKPALLALHKIVRPAAWWPAWLAAAAALALLGVIAVFRLKPSAPPQFAAYRAAMADFAEHKLDRLDLMSHDMAEVRRWLDGQNAHGDLVLPAGLDGQPSLGCRVLEWHGRKVTLICFELPSHQIAHLLVVDRDAFPDAPTESPQLMQSKELATVSWSRGNITYLLVGKAGTEPDLLSLL